LWGIRFVPQVEAMKELRRNEWVTIATAATRLAVTQTLIRRWIHRYQLAPNPRGEYWFHNLVDIEHSTRHSPGARRKLTSVPAGVTLRDR
jgi:hypothetical protein